MWFKKIYFDYLMLFLCIFYTHCSHAFFSSFSHVGHSLRFGITIDSEVTFNIDYDALFQNSSNYRASVGFKLLKIMHAHNYDATVYVSCRHNDGLDSLQQILSLMATRRHQLDSGVAKELHDDAQGGKEFSLKSFLFRTIFSLNKTVSVHINPQSLKWSFSSGIEPIVNALSQSDSSQDSQVVTALANHYSHAVIGTKCGSISFDQALFHTLLHNHALQLCVIAAGSGTALHWLWDDMKQGFNKRLMEQREDNKVAMP